MVRRLLPTVTFPMGLRPSVGSRPLGSLGCWTNCVLSLVVRSRRPSVCLSSSGWFLGSPPLGPGFLLLSFPPSPPGPYICTRRSEISCALPISGDICGAPHFFSMGFFVIPLIGLRQQLIEKVFLLLFFVRCSVSACMWPSSNFNCGLVVSVRVRVRVCAVSYTHLRAHETCADLVCRLLLEKKKVNIKYKFRFV